jgi:hypothetical protein
LIVIKGPERLIKPSPVNSSFQAHKRVVLIDDRRQSRAKQITTGWFGRLGWHEKNALNNSVSHTQHSRRQKGIPKINSWQKSHGFFPHRPETLQKRILQIHNYRRIIINLQKNHGRLDTFGITRDVRYMLSMEQQKPNNHADKTAPDLQTTMAFLGIVIIVAVAIIQSENWITFSFWAFVLFGASMFYALSDSDCHEWVLGKFGQTRWTRSYRGLVGVPFTKIWRRISGPLPRQASSAATRCSAAQPSVMEFALRVATYYRILLLRVLEDYSGPLRHCGHWQSK